MNSVNSGDPVFASSKSAAGNSDKVHCYYVLVVGLWLCGNPSLVSARFVNHL